MFEDFEFKISLASDNHAGIHPRVLDAIVAANRGSAHAYGLDEVSRTFDIEITRVFGPTARAHLVFNGTAANVLALATAVPSHGAVICADVAHLHLDECGAPEKFLGAKVLTVPSTDGRITPAQAEHWLTRRGDQHAAQPAAVSLTQPTELGVCYTVEELAEWGRYCRAKNLMFHIDGARLANAAAFLNCDLRTLTADVGVDALSFGGTKNGLLGAEAVVLFGARAESSPFRFVRKQAMQLPSKTRFLAAQFYAYLADDLWLEIARHVTTHARSLAARLPAEIEIVHPVESNALFVRLPAEWIKPLREHAFFYVWDRPSGVARWMIGFDWRTDDERALLARLSALTGRVPAD